VKAASVFRAVLALAAVIAVSACMTSQRPLFDTASAVTPLAAGTYGSFERQDDNSYKRDATITIERGGNGYDFINEEKKATSITLYELRPDTFVGQAKGNRGDYAYLVFRIAGADIFIHIPDCEKQDKTRISEFGARIERLECKLDKVGDVKGFFAMLDLGQPHAKLVRDK
jgi:hypothetical protein